MIPVLDKGYVKLLDNTFPSDKFDTLIVNVNRGLICEKVLNIPNIVLEIKCPVFVRLYLSDNNIDTSSMIEDKEVEVYKPTINDISARDLQASTDIQNSIAKTSDTLILNKKMYDMDLCNKFVSQVNYPIGSYVYIVAWGSLNSWMKLVCRKSLPKPVEEYNLAFRSIITSEWPNYNNYVKQMKR